MESANELKFHPATDEDDEKLFPKKNVQCSFVFVFSPFCCYHRRVTAINDISNLIFILDSRVHRAKQ